MKTPLTTPSPRLPLRASNHPGLAELARHRHSRLLVLAILFSVAANLLMLTSPIYMLQVYDRVLSSRSEATLISLTLLVTLLFLLMGLFDHARSRLLARIGARLQAGLDRRVFSAALEAGSANPDDPSAASAPRDLDAMRQFWASPAVTSIIDMPWTPIFLAAIFIFHPILGWLAVAGGVIVVALAILNQIATRRAVARTTAASLQADRSADRMVAEAETIRALGMTGAAFDRWQKTRGFALTEGLSASDIAGANATASRTFRLFLQSAMLGLAAWVVLKGELTPGAMIAASILMGRALQPVEQAVAHWSTLQRAMEARRRLADLLAQVPASPPRTALPRPTAHLAAANLAIRPPGQPLPTLRGVSFTLEPGQALGVIGPSGAGKSTLARALIGLWPTAVGSLRLNGATLDQYDPDQLGRWIGYLPQRITLFDGTIAENIARLAPPDDAAVIAAAQKAAAHDMILRLPDGYDTRIDASGGRLSGGQMQRVALARALYGDPPLLILDEPNSQLDNDGSNALNTALRAHKAAGGAALIMAHRPAAIQECETLLILENGQPTAYGPRDQVLRDRIQNAAEIVRSSAPGSLR